MIITIDGPAGSGKSTVASHLAKKLGYIHFNSGSLYRAITAFLLTNNKLEALKQNKIPKIKLEIEYINGVQHIYVNGVDYTPFIRNNEVSINTPFVSSMPKIRQIVDKAQREFGKTHNVVIDGRDIGSFVFPKADFKFYLDCDVKIRAMRRRKELNNSVPLDEIERQLVERDEFDKNKKIAPLIIPKNAIMIDSSHLSVAEVVDLMLKHIK